MEIEVGIGPAIEDAQVAEEEMLQEAAPKGKFTPKGLNSLVKATNQLLPLFEQEGDYPTFDADLTELPSDFVRVLSMFQAAIGDAIAAEEVEAELGFELMDLRDDTGLTGLAGKLASVAKSKDFKKFLAVPKAEEDEAPAEEAPAPDAEPEMSDDDLFMSRL